MRMLFLAMISALALVPAGLHAQSAGAGGRARAEAGGQVRSEAPAGTPAARIEAALAAAARAGVPASLLESKRAEGQAKGVAEERIAAAIENRLAALVRASDAMKGASLEVGSAGELSLVADALQAGVSESAVIRLGREAPAETRGVAIAVLADLVRLGNGSSEALTRVTGALGSSSALASLHAEVASQLRLGGLSSTLDAAGMLSLP